MKVTRITLDADLGIIELQTGPGGDGNYVLLPIDIPPTAERYLRFPGEPSVAEAPNEGSLIAAGGWSVPKDQAYDFNTTPGIKAYQADLEDPPRFERGGTLYPGSKAAKERELNSYLAADSGPINESNSERTDRMADECAGDCGAHVKPGRDGGFWDTDGPARERHTGPATVPDPVHVFATDYGHGYRLTCPALPQWTRTINRYDLHRVPGLIAAALGEKRAVSVTIIEEQ